MRQSLALLVGLSLLLGGAAPAAQTAEELAKETQNPVANLISVPFQNNFNFGAGPDNEMIWIMNVQPVIPIPLNEDWNLPTSSGRWSAGATHRSTPMLH